MIILESLRSKEFTLVTGIANPTPLIDHLNSLELNFEHMAFKDHHNFSSKELKQLSEKEFVLTTEKDYNRLNKLNYEGIEYLEIELKILNEKKLINFLNKKL